MDTREAIKSLLLSKEFRNTHDEGMRAKMLERKVVNLIETTITNPLLKNKESLRDMLDSVDAALEFIFNDASSHGVSFTEGMINTLADITALLHISYENMDDVQNKLERLASNGD